MKALRANRRQGQSQVEYILLIALIGVAVLVALEGLGYSLQGFFNDTSEKTNSVATGQGVTTNGGPAKPSSNQNISSN